MSAATAMPGGVGPGPGGEAAPAGEALQWSLFLASLVGLAALATWTVRHPAPVASAPDAFADVAARAVGEPPMAEPVTVEPVVVEPITVASADPAAAEPVAAAPTPGTPPASGPSGVPDGDAGGGPVVVAAQGGRRIALGGGPSVVATVPAPLGPVAAPPGDRAAPAIRFPSLASLTGAARGAERSAVDPPARPPGPVPAAVADAPDAAPDTGTGGGTGRPGAIAGAIADPGPGAATDRVPDGVDVDVDVNGGDGGDGTDRRAEELAVLAGLSARLRYAPGESVPGVTGDDALGRMVEPLARYRDLDVIVSVSGRELEDPVQDAALARERAAHVVDRLVGLGLYRGRFLIRLEPDAPVPVPGQHVRVAARGDGLR